MRKQAADYIEQQQREASQFATEQQLKKQQKIEKNK